jgi:hypothetical protein
MGRVHSWSKRGQTGALVRVLVVQAGVKEQKSEWLNEEAYWRPDLVAICKNKSGEMFGSVRKVFA